MVFPSSVPLQSFLLISSKILPDFFSCKLQGKIMEFQARSLLGTNFRAGASEHQRGHM